MLALGAEAEQERLKLEKQAEDTNRRREEVRITKEKERAQAIAGTEDAVVSWHYRLVEALAEGINEAGICLD